MARSLHLRFSLCTTSDSRPGPGRSLFFVASAFRPVWPGRCDLSFICIPQSTRALDQGAVEPRQAVSPKALRPWTIPLRYSVGSLDQGGVFFLVASAFRPVWPGRCDLSFICIPQSTRALDQGGVEPRQAVSPKALRPWTIPLRYSVGSLDQGGVEPRLAVNLRPEGHQQYHYSTDVPTKLSRILAVYSKKEMADDEFTPLAKLNRILAVYNKLRQNRGVR